ncbi:B12-binding domain-containing radical SAM protein [Alkaliphilus sp. MSJ-5]|uniref:B12-binding domain-containing radical SAM protein n=1 Tax=Alkaliphilus flagellatus TaxID=2841507 RepID=A0ABS6G5Y6_9FIRM|nr:B12-binding domain-containing radical SAM protein [Alkaliphilus flagellatus]MBU5676786.1 B12-binding domain-containing radical SAM protein [Alkaliphilus flagellatus]
MKVLLTALNAKYIHTNLAVRYLEKSVIDIIDTDDIKIKEFTINNSMDYIIREIYNYSPDILCFSCYIWNMDMIDYITKHIKKIMPEVMIVLGGPEVSFDTAILMEENDAIDIVVIGEGEDTFRQLMLALKNNHDYSLVEGIAFRARGQVVFTESKKTLPSMEDLPFPYTGESLDADKIVYYESSRGCPFNCQYCLSSSISGVRFLPIERVKNEIKYFIDQGVRQVKFVDRTFNAKKSYAMEIMNFILEYHRGKTNFHFEVTADLLDDDILTFLSTVPVGLFQFEIGVQSTNEKTLNIIDRHVDFGRLSEVVRRISQSKNIHQHLDLIVGLPEEDYFSFRKSFDDVFALRPEKLQIGFLKLLKGSGLRNRAGEYGYVYSDYPPYEVMETTWLSYGDIIRLKGLEEMVEIYWNSGIFNNSIELIINNFYSSSFKFFEELWKYWQAQGHHHISHSKNKLYEILAQFYSWNKFNGVEIFKEVLKLDFLKNTKSSFLPSIFNRVEIDGFKNKCHEFLQSTKNVKTYLPLYEDIPAKQIIKQVHFEPFNVDVTIIDRVKYKIDSIEEKQVIVLFDYQIESKALEDCKYYKINFDE